MSFASWRIGELESHRDSLLNRNEALELVYLYAKDILAFWPQFTFKKVPVMVQKMNALKQAIEAVK